MPRQPHPKSGRQITVAERKAASKTVLATLREACVLVVMSDAATADDAKVEPTLKDVPGASMRLTPRYGNSPARAPARNH